MCLIDDRSECNFLDNGERIRRGVVRCGSKGQNASFTMRAFGAAVTRSFGRSTNRLVTYRAGFCFLLKQSAAAVATSREGHHQPISDLAVHHPLRTLEPLQRLRLMRVKPSRTQKYL